MTININSVDKKQYVNRDSFRIEQNLTSQVDTCSFDMVDPDVAPESDDVIEILDGATKIFAGKITIVRIAPRSYGSVVYSITCKDWTAVIDGKLVAETYETETVENIMTDLKTQGYIPAEITLTNVVCDVEVDFIRFAYEPVSKCIQRLADLVGYDWYIDYDKDIHFFQSATVSAPFDLTDNGNKFEFGSLRVTKNGSQIKNAIIVRGGEYLGNTNTGSVVADGEQTNFVLPYKYQNLTISVNATPQTVGIDNIDNPDDFDCLYNFQEKIVKFPDTTKPSADDIVSWSGNPYIPLIVQYRDTDSIAERGEKAFLIRDSRIKTKQSAKERAIAEVQTYLEEVTEGEFKTYESGLRTGQSILINSTTLGINETFVINRVVVGIVNDTSFRYQCSVVSKKTYDLIQFLTDLFSSSKVTEEVIDEVLQKIYNSTESLQITDSATTSKTSGPYEWGDFNWGYGTWS